MEGSGYFLVNSSEQDIVTITYMEAESSIQVRSKDSLEVDNLKSDLILMRLIGKIPLYVSELL